MYGGGGESRAGACEMRQLTEWVGRRVALRHRVGERDGRVLQSDAVGELADDGADAVVVHTRRGPVRVARAAVTAVRLVPPPVPRRPSWAAVVRLEGLCADAWPAQVDVPMGAWRLRAAGDFTARANSALAIGNPGCPLPDALARARAFAAEHDVAARVQVPMGSPWDRAVAGAGWVLDISHPAGAEVAVLVGELATLAAPVDEVELLDRPDPRWWAVALGGMPSPAQRHVLDPDPPARTAFGLVPDVGAVRGAVVEDHLYLSALEVRPEVRRRGYAQALTAAIAGWGLARGTRWAVLQVALHNSAALALYDHLGLVEHHRYRYLVPPTRPARMAVTAAAALE